MKRRVFLSHLLAAPALLPAADSEPWRVAVMGHTGRGGYGHGLDTLWLQLPEAKIVAVADADPKGLAEASKRLKVSQSFEDYRRMLSETKPEIVAIGPRHIDQHHEMTLVAIEAGVRGIYMEKPFCRTLREADDIVTACERKQVKLALAHRNRYHPVLPVLVKMIEDGAIGRVLEYRARGKEDARGGGLDLWVLGSHVLNLIAFFAGDPVACTATVQQSGRLAVRADVSEGAEGIGPLAGNEVHARFEMANGLPAFFDSVQNAGVAKSGFGLQIIGTEGVIDLRMDEEPLAHWRRGSPFRPDPEPRGWEAITTAGVGKPEPLTDIRKLVGGHLLPARDLFAAICDQREPLCSARDGRVTVEMISAVFESHRQGGQRVSLPLAERDSPLTRW